MLRCTLSVVLLTSLANAQTPPSEGEIIFQRTVGPALRDRCATCHGAALQTSRLRVDSRAALLKGGAHGPAIAPGDPSTSLLLTAMEQGSKLKMPPGSKLPDATVAAVRRWIELGAPWSEKAPEPHTTSDDTNATWAFQPLSKSKATSIDQSIAKQTPGIPLCDSEYESRRFGNIHKGKARSRGRNRNLLFSDLV